MSGLRRAGDSGGDAGNGTGCHGAGRVGACGDQKCFRLGIGTKTSPGDGIGEPGAGVGQKREGQVGMGGV